LNTEHPAQSNKHSRRFWLGLLFISLLNGAILVYFHDRFWWPPDDAVYAHTAERILDGEVLNKDVEEIHTGYIHFVHVAAFANFGVKLVSLRYPLIIVGFLQSLLVFLIFARHNLVVALIAAATATAFGVIQYLNPQPSWYCLFFATLIAFCLMTLPREHRWRLVLVGLLMGLVFFFRQITGVFVAMGVLTYVLTETTEEAKGSDTLLSRSLLALMLVGTILYLKSATNAYGLALVGLWPIVLIVQSLLSVKTGNRRSLHIILRLGIGFLVAAMPLFIYHVYHGSLRPFFDDTVLRAFNIQELAYLKVATYTLIQQFAYITLRQFRSFSEVLNAIFWIVLPFSTLITGILCVRAFGKSRSSYQVGALPVLAVFYALVALFQQIPIYYFYILPLTYAGLFWLASKHFRRSLWAVGAVAVVMSVIVIYYQAGQPLTRMLSGIIRGERVPFVTAEKLERTGLVIDPKSLDIYTTIVQTIKNNSRQDDAIFAMPYNPEFYFLSDRKNPFRFWNTFVGIRSDAEQEQVMEVFRNTPPRVVVIAPRDRNNTNASRAIIEYVRANYTMIQVIDDFEVYRAP
jgi:hypothetical protein